MARINIEDSIFKDFRFNQLCIKLGSLDTALGAMVRAWSLAQRWYVTPERLIPIEQWKTQAIPDAIIEVGLAELLNGKIRVKGSEEQFKWLEQRIEAGRKGGLKSQGNSASGRSAVAKQTQASSSSSFSYSNTNTKKENLNFKKIGDLGAGIFKQMPKK